MRVVYAVQRYGAAIGAGAEQHCREMAERLVGRGHEVHVVTTCAHSYVDWANEYPPGESSVGGVTVHRFPVTEVRVPATFDALSEEVLAPGPVRPMDAQEEWLRRQGPLAPGMVGWLEQHGAAFDVIVFFTFLYWPTWAGLRACAGAFPTVLHPTVHDEPALRLSLYRQVFEAPDAFALSTSEEADLIRGRFHIEPEGAVVGIGVDPVRGDPDAFRRAVPAIGDAPYLLYVGRVDAGKGAVELYEHFAAYKAKHPGELTLVYVGEPLVTLPTRPDVVMTGYLDVDARNGALAGALALAQPSRFESFSMILTEAFAQGRPALVQGASAVLAGHARRSGGAMAYRDATEFATSLHALVAQPGLADEMGGLGRAYVERHYQWDVVMDRYEALLSAVAERRAPGLAQDTF